MSRLLAPLFALLLAGCAGLQSAQPLTPEQHVYAARAGYNQALAQLVAGCESGVIKPPDCFWLDSLRLTVRAAIVQAEVVLNTGNAPAAETAAREAANQLAILRQQLNARRAP